MYTLTSVGVEPDASGALPIIVGVTGHRDLIGDQSHRARLEAAVAEILDRLATRCPNTRLILLSPLAEGADRLVARVALAKGARLIVPLPMPIEKYLEDFEDDDSRTAFQELLNEADHSFVVPAGDSASSPESAYARVGAVIARECQILIALWDGKEGKEGGTGTVVRYKLHGVPRAFDPSRSALDQAECGVVYQIVTPRISNPSPKGAFDRIDTYPGTSPERAKAAKAACWRIFGCIETFNRTRLKLGPRLNRERERSKAELFKAGGSTHVSARVRAYAEMFAVANSLAIHFQKRTKRTIKLLFVLAFVAFFFFTVSYRRPPGSEAWAGHAYTLALVLPFLPYALGWWHDIQKHYLDFRALAEGVRVQLYWCLAGLNQGAANTYLRLQRTELEWVRDALRNWTFACERLPSNDGLADEHARLGLVRDCWVKQQARFYQKNVFRLRRWLMAFVAGGWVFVAIGSLWAVLRSWAGFEGVELVPWVVRLVDADPGLLDGRNRLLLELGSVLLGLGPVIAGLCFGYAKVIALSENANRYEQAGITFNLALQTMEQCLKGGTIDQDSLEHCREILLDLGKEALIENGSWLMLLRDRPLGIPKI